jgi:hypothetical protein
MFAKTNEVLGLKCFANRYGVKPRTIQSVHTGVLVSCQPYILQAVVRLKEVMEEPFDVTLNGSTKRFWVTYASGMVDGDLTAWLLVAQSYAREGIICFIVNGDDSLTVQLKDGKILYIEADYSCFDQTQKKVQNNAERRILASLGVPRGICEILKIISKAKAIGRKRNRKVPYHLLFSPDGCNRVTGAPNTSISNTTNNIEGLIIAAFYDFSPEGWENVGFTAVTVFSYDVTETTFLRGTWWPHEDGTYRWGILPSAILKLGKVMASKRSKIAIHRFAYGMALGMGEVPEHFPILGSLRKKLFELGRENAAIRNKYKPMSEMNDTLNRQSVLAWMFRRYGITVAEVEEVESLIHSITSLPHFLGHSVFTRLAQDY